MTIFSKNDTEMGEVRHRQMIRAIDQLEGKMVILQDEIVSILRAIEAKAGEQSETVELLRRIEANVPDWSEPGQSEVAKFLEDIERAIEANTGPNSELVGLLRQIEAKL